MTAALLLVLGCGADPTRDADGDGFPASEDCDDRDAGVHPGAEDAPDDGLDGDCDGYDLGSEPLLGFERIEPDVATAHLQLGYDLRLGDVDGDGVDDVLAGSRESYATSEDFVAERGEAWLFAGGTLAPRSRWTGTRGPQLLGETLAIVQGQAGPQLALEALEGVWVLPPDAGRGYPGDVGGVLLDNDGDGYAAGHGLDAMDLLGTPDEDLVAGCARDNPEHQSAVCIHEGPVTADALVGDAAAIVDGPGGRWLAGGDFDGDARPTSPAAASPSSRGPWRRGSTAPRSWSTSGTASSRTTGSGGGWRRAIWTGTDGTSSWPRRSAGRTGPGGGGCTR